MSLQFGQSECLAIIVVVGVQFSKVEIKLVNFDQKSQQDKDLVLLTITSSETIWMYPDLFEEM